MVETERSHKLGQSHECSVRIVAEEYTGLRPAGGVNHPDSVSAKVGKLAAKKALR